MIVASLKRKENIAEYLLYMWQVEDIIRANELDIDKIEANVINYYKADETTHRQIVEWYESLIDMMRREEVVEHGHLQINKNIIVLLADLHNKLHKDTRFDEYAKAFYSALPFIVELRSKAGDNPTGEIETCFNALYGMLMLRLKSQEISKNTQVAIAQISKFIALLSHYFKLDENDELFKDEE